MNPDDPRPHRADADPLAEMAWALRLCCEVHRLPPRGTARCVRLIQAIATRLHAGGTGFIFSCDAASRRASIVRELNPTPAVTRPDRARLDANLIAAVRALDGTDVAQERTLAHLRPLGGDRHAAIVLHRPRCGAPFDPSDARWVATLHGSFAWLYEAFAAPGRSMLHALAPRERETLSHLLSGASEKQVATALSRSPHTVHAYVKRIYRTLGVNSRGELLAIFVDADARREVTAQAPRRRPAG